MFDRHGRSIRDATINEIKSYKKVQKLFRRGSYRLRNIVSDRIDDHVIDIFTEIIQCRLCSQFLVMTARNSCCESCFLAWMNDNDSDDEIIKCKKCDKPIKTVLSARSLKMFCEAVEIEETTKRNGHFGYPVLSNVAMDLLFEGLKSDPDLNVERRLNS